MHIYQLHHVTAACGPRLAKYVKSKTRGGAAGQKGTRYEDKFALLKIGEAANRAFAKYGVFSNRCNVTFQGQAPCFVDDLVVFGHHPKSADHFQTKNAVSVVWGAGAKSVAYDFRQQLKLGKSRNLKTNLALVVSNRSLAKRLQSNIPKDLKKKVAVVYFPDGTLVSLLKFLPMRNGLSELMGPDPSEDHLLSAGRMLIGIWSDVGKAVTLKKMLSELLKAKAPLIRPLTPVITLDARLTSVLDAIPNFNYAVEKGFFIWRYGSMDRGCFPEHCGADRFSAFTERIISRRPRTFSKLEVELG